jgi:sialic acid synthase SpsE
MKTLYLIAETACSHEGSISRLKKMTSFAIRAGFDAIQLQIWKKEKMISADHKDFNTLKKIEIKYFDWEKVIKYIRKLSRKVDIICCVYESETLNFCLKNNIKHFKVHSSDVGNIDFLKEIAKSAKRIDLSIGGCKKNEIYKAISVLKKYRNCKIWLMYGIQLFPTDPKKVNIGLAKEIAKKYNLFLGYQDHSNYDVNGYVLPAAAIGNGIKIIEKHITDENKKNRIDGQSAIEIKNYKTFVDICKNTEKFTNKKKTDELSPEELKYRDYSKKQIIYNSDLIKGTKIKKNNLIFLRTSKKGEIVDNVKFFINRKICRNVKKFTNLKRSDF